MSTFTVPKKGWLAPKGVVLFEELVRDGKKVSEIAKALRMSRAAVYYRLKKLREGKKERAPTPAQKRVKSVAKKLAGMMEKRDKKGLPKINSASEAMIRLGKSGIHVSRATAHRYMTKHRAWRRRSVVPKLTAVHIKKRKDFCKENKDSAENIWFSDEKIWGTNDATRGMWCGDEEEPIPREKEKWGASVHVWGLIGVGVKVLVFHEKGAINAQKYCELLKTHLLPLHRSRRRHNPVVFMQDGAPCHTATLTTKLLSDTNVVVLKWPPNSPDLNPIENLWAIVSAKVVRHYPSTVGELRAAVEKEWEAVPQPTVDKLVRSFERRREAVSKAPHKKCQN